MVASETGARYRWTTGRPGSTFALALTGYRAECRTFALALTGASETGVRFRWMSLRWAPHLTMGRHGWTFALALTGYLW